MSSGNQSLIENFRTIGQYRLISPSMGHCMEHLGTCAPPPCIRGISATLHQNIQTLTIPVKNPMPGAALQFVYFCANLIMNKFDAQSLKTICANHFSYSQFAEGGKGCCNVCAAVARICRIIKYITLGQKRVCFCVVSPCLIFWSLWRHVRNILPRRPLIDIYI